MRSIDPTLLSKINKQNQTIYENANPKMSVVVARARSSVRDSSYFMIEKIREKEGITDIAVAARRMLPYGPPDKLFNIWLDNGLVRVGHREYPDKLKAGWQNDFDIEDGKAVSIVFDGRWELNKYKTWGKRTDELPWLFWVDTINILKAQLWNTGPIIELATDVVKIDSMRGWVPVQPGHIDDQGIIIAYTKSDGKVYYRNYCIQETAGLTIWESEKEVTELGTENLGIRLFRSNDFRVGFIGEKATGNVMVLTKRNYSGMSIEPNKFNANVHIDLNFIPLEYIDYDAGENFMAEISAEVRYCPADKLDVAVDSFARGNNYILITLDKQIVRVEGSNIAFAIVGDINNYEIFDVVINNEEGTLKLISTIFEPTEDLSISFDHTKAEIVTYEDFYCGKITAPSFDIFSEGIPPLAEGQTSESFTAMVSMDLELVPMIKSVVYTEGKFTADIKITLAFYDLDDAPL